MDFNPKLTPQDVEDAAALTLPRFYYLRLVVENWYGVGLVLVLLWLTIGALLGYNQPNWYAMAAIWAVFAGIVIWAVLDTKRRRAREVENINRAAPDVIRFTSEGLVFEGPSGAHGLRPWRLFSGWREGRRVVLLEEGSAVVILPVAHLSDHERQTVRAYLQSQLPPRQTSRY